MNLRFSRSIFAAILCGISAQLSAATCQQISFNHSVDHDALWQDFSYLAGDAMQGRKTGTVGSAMARDYLQTRFEQIGAEPVFENGSYTQTFHWPDEGDDNIGVNVAAHIRGSQPHKGTIVVTAHYDHLGQKGRRIFNGADDNASGTAALLAFAHTLKQFPLEHDVVLLATDAEEPGLYGARAFLQNPPLPLEQIRFNLNLDMLANGGYRNQLFAYTSRKSEPIGNVVDKIREEAGICVKYRRNGSNMRGSSSRINWRQASDHGAFDRHDIPFLYLGVAEHGQYHTPDDTVASIDRRFYLASVETALSVLQAMDGIKKTAN